MTTGEYLLGRFGPLMSIVDVATLLGRSPDGVRVALYTDTDFSRKLRPAMLRVGRRVYFRTLQVTEVFTQRADKMHVISLRKANSREVRNYVEQT